MRRLFAAFLTICLISCNSETNTYNVDGLAEGFEENTPILVYTVANNQPVVIDTLIVTNGKFAGKLDKVEDPSIHYLNIEKYKGNVLFFPENEDLNVTLYKDSIQSSVVNGGSQNESYTQFSRKLRAFNVQKQSNIELYRDASAAKDNAALVRIQKANKELVAEETAFKKDFVSTNNNSIFGVMMLSEMLSRKEITPAEASKILGNLSPKMAASPVAKQLKTVIEGLRKSEVGGIAPGFSAPTPDGQELALSEVLGEYTIIDFWASWCRPCRAENPNVVRVYEKYHDKGLNIISVSLDKEGQKERWLKAIKDDKMNWHHVSNLKFWQEPIARTYGVRSIPATFLLDEQGTIIAKNLRGPALETKIASLLGRQ